jgi:N-acetylneuraminic acid mutarotase/uncharacterized protein YkwD
VPRSRPIRPRPRVEELERRDLLAGFAPTAVEQQFLEQLNDIRANPPAFSDFTGVDLSAVAPSQPLAFNPLLIEAARLHSQDMNVNNYAGHVGPDGLTPDQRIRNTGLVPTGDGESIAVGIQMSTSTAVAGLIQDFGQPDVGHRRHLLAIDAAFKPQNQVGVGAVLNGTGSYGNYYTIDTISDSDPRPFLTGVVYNDANSNGHYDIGEGLGGVVITITGVGSFAAWDTGGYSIRLSPGTYSVTASGGLLAAPISTTVTIRSVNDRLNFIGHNPQSWTTLADLPTARQELAAATGSDGRIYAIGGVDSSHLATNIVEAFQPSSGTWSSAAALPTARSGLAAVTGLDGLIYAIGGAAATGVTGEVDVYDPTKNQWTTLSTDPMPTPREAMDAALGADGKIYVFGGYDNSLTPLNAAEVFDPSAAAGHHWSTLPGLPLARGGGGAARGADGRIYLVGGTGGGMYGVPLSRVDVFTPGSASLWSQAGDLPDSMFIDTAVSAGADGKIYAFGGFNQDLGQLNAVVAYQPSLDTWGIVANLPTARSKLAATLGTDGQIYTLGGELQFNNGGVTTFGMSAAAEALSTGHTQDPIYSFTILSYSGPPLPPALGPGSGSHIANITGEIAVGRGPLRRLRKGWQQTLTLGNRSGSFLQGPVALVFDHLGKSTRLRHAAGRTKKHRPTGSPYVIVYPGPDAIFAPNEIVTITVQFVGARPHYSLRVLSGSGKL